MIFLTAALAAPAEATLPPAGAGALQHIRVEALTEPRSWAPGLVVVLHRVEGDERLQLAADPARQGFYTAEVEGEPLRFLDVELEIEGNTAWRRLSPLIDPTDSSFSFLIDAEGPTVTRVAWMPWAGAPAQAGNGLSLALAFGWGGLVFGYVAWLARARR